MKQSQIAASTNRLTLAMQRVYPMAQLIKTTHENTDSAGSLDALVKGAQNEPSMRIVCLSDATALRLTTSCHVKALSVKQLRATEPKYEATYAFTLSALDAHANDVIALVNEVQELCSYLESKGYNT